MESSVHIYSVVFYGNNLNINSLTKYFRKSTVKCIGKNNGSLSFDYREVELLIFLEEIESVLQHIRECGVEEIQVWGLLTRSGQLNGELSEWEIKKLSEIGASFCWSMVLDDSE